MMYGETEATLCSKSVEKELAYIDEQLGEYESFSEAIRRFMHSPIRHSVLDNREVNNFFFGLYGAMALKIPQLNEERVRLIEALEKEEAEREKLAEVLLAKRNK